MNVDSVARNALKKANRKLIDGVLPYRLNEEKRLSMGYLSGFMAENRDMEKDSFVNEVKEEVRLGLRIQSQQSDQEIIPAFRYERTRYYRRDLGNGPASCVDSDLQW